jgi:hypothetical protein
MKSMKEAVVTLRKEQVQTEADATVAKRYKTKLLEEYVDHVAGGAIDAHLRWHCPL